MALFVKTVEHKTILIVEDSEPLIRELRDYFSVANEVHAASTLEAASDCVKFPLTVMTV